MNKVKFIIASVLSFLFCITANAQTSDNTDVMRSNGKIYVVVAVVVTIVLGIFIYLINLDRKISKIEKGRK